MVENQGRFESPAMGFQVNVSDNFVSLNQEVEGPEELVGILKSNKQTRGAPPATTAKPAQQKKPQNAKKPANSNNQQQGREAKPKTAGSRPNNQKRSENPRGGNEGYLQIAPTEERTFERQNERAQDAEERRTRPSGNFRAKSDYQRKPPRTNNNEGSAEAGQNLEANRGGRFDRHSRRVKSSVKAAVKVHGRDDAADWGQELNAEKDVVQVDSVPQEAGFEAPENVNVEGGERRRGGNNFRRGQNREGRFGGERRGRFEGDRPERRGDNRRKPFDNEQPQGAVNVAEGEQAQQPQQGAEGGKPFRKFDRERERERDRDGRDNRDRERGERGRGGFQSRGPGRQYNRRENNQSKPFNFSEKDFPNF